MDINRMTGFLFSGKGRWVLLGLFALLVFFVNLGCDGLHSAQEGRAGVVARNMLATGDWLTMHYKGADTSEKPIFCYWLYAVSGKVFGINEFSLRLPSALASLFCVWVVAYMGCRIYGARAGLLAAYVLCTMVSFVNLGRAARIDIVLAAFYTGAMLCLYKGYFEKGKATWWLYVFYVVLGLSVMVKGPVGVVLAGFLIFCYGVLFRRWGLWWELKPVSGVLIVLLLSAPWYIYESMRTHGEFATSFLVEHNIKRFLGGSEFKEGKFMPIYYYFPKFFAGTLPWSLALPGMLWQYRKRFTSLRTETNFLALWVVTGFVFFSLAALKRGDYLLPIYPAAAILTGRYLEVLASLKFRMSSRWVWGWGVLAAVAAAAVILLKTGLIRRVGEIASRNEFPHLSTRDGFAMMLISDMIERNFWIYLLVLLAVLAFLFAIGKVLARGEALRAVGWFLPGMLLVMLIHFQFIEPVLARYESNKFFSIECAGIVPADGKVLHIDNLNSEIVFFLNRDYDFAPGNIDISAYVDNAEYVVMPGKSWRNRKDSGIFKDFELAAKTIDGHHNRSVMLARKVKKSPAAGLQ